MRLEINWWHGYNNSPEFVVHAEVPAHDTFLWGVYPKGNHDYLISTNNDPWVKYAAIVREGRYGDPSLYGNSGGPRKLTNGEIYESRTGWSSRASVINKYFRHLMPNEDLISEVTVNTPQGGRWAGFNLTKTKLDELVAEYNYCNHPELIYIVVTEREDGEISLTPSIQPDKVVKAPHGH